MNHGTHGDATDGWVGFMLCARGSCPQSCSSGCFLDAVACPVVHGIVDVVKTINGSEGASEEGGPPLAWEWKQHWYAMLGAIHSWGEEHMIAVADGSFCGRGASVGSEEVGPVAPGAKGWVLPVPTMFSRCGNVVSKEKPNSSIGAVVFVKDDDCLKTMCNFYDCAFLVYHGEQHSGI